VSPLRILHCHSTFSLGGKEARAVRLMNVFGDAAVHTVLSAAPDQLAARDAIDRGVQVTFPGEAAPPLHGKPSLARYRALTNYMKQFDLVLTYNWGSMDAVGARRLFPAGVPRLIHHEDGFNADEAVKLNWKRNGFRRLMLGAAERIVVVSERLEDIAQSVWRQNSAKIVRIPNGVETALYRDPPAANIPGLNRAAGDVIVGTLAGLRPVKNLCRLVRAVAAQPAHVKLVIVGEGPDRAKIMAEAGRLGIAGRVVLPGFMAAPHRYIGHFDIFALSSDSEQFPISLVEAMAAGKAAVSTDVGDVSAIVSAANRPHIVPIDDEAAFAAALADLISEAALRRAIGAANQARAVEFFDEAGMIDQYRALYGVRTTGA
jgi:L-malate glycosyltransferase